MSESNRVTLEERFSKMEELLSKMESRDVTLEESFSLYQEGLAEVKAANEMLDQIEKAMLVLNENGELEEF